MKKIIGGVLLAVGLLFASAISGVAADGVVPTGSAAITAQGPYLDAKSYPSINAAVAAIADTRTTLLVSDTQTLASSLVIPATLSLKITNGGSIAKASDYTLKINGPLEADLYPIFTGFSEGGVTFGLGAVKEVYPEWWYTNDYASAINQAIASIRALRGGKIVFTRDADITKPINATGLDGITFEGASGAFGSGGVTLTGKLDSVIFDCTNSRDLTFRDFMITGHPSFVPKAGFLFARNPIGSNCGGYRFYNMRSTYDSRFSVAVVYSYGSECNDYYSCCFCNAAPGGKVMVITGSNIFSLTSPYAPMATGSQSNSVTNIYGGSFYNQGGPKSDILYLDSADDLHIYGGFWYCANHNTKEDGRSMIYVDTTKSSSNIVSIDGLRMESGEFMPAYGVYFGDAASEQCNWSIANSRFCVKKNVVYVHDKVTLHYLTMKGVFPQYAGAFSAKYLNYPDINFPGDFEIRAGGLLKGGIVAATSFTLAGSATQATLIDLSTGSINSAYGSMHDRGNPTAPDFTRTALTADGTVHDLNLASIVPAGAKSVVIRVEVKSAKPGKSISFCAPGLGSDMANVFNKSTVATQAAGVYNYADVVVACGDARTIRYLATKTAWEAINITVKGWFK